jgi:mono/diheme cytochrome c family protein
VALESGILSANVTKQCKLTAIMRIAKILAALAILATPGPAFAAEEVSVERGRLVSIIGSCHDCHTDGYREAEGAIDPTKALRGKAIGWRGPWGTTYANGLRWNVRDLSEDGYVTYIKTLRTLPPMPWYNVRVMPESDVRSFYQYVKSLGDPGEFLPVTVRPGEEPRTPFVTLEPPQMPKPCSRDLDCGVGEVCSAAPVRQCIKK